MKGDRLRVPVDGNYLCALGMAVFAFARLEWAAVCCCERIRPNTINTRAVRMANRVADEFKGLVPVRNELLHTQPAETDEGAQQLFRDGRPWTIEKIDDAADALQR